MSITIHAVGDIMLGEQPLCENFGVSSVIQAMGMDYLMSEVTPVLRNGDIVFGNLECSLASGETKGSRKAFFSAPIKGAGGLRAAGFTLLSVANNHIMENGRIPFTETVRALRQQKLIPAGIREVIPVLNVKGSRIAVLSYSYIEDGIADVCYNKIRSEEPVLADIRKVRPDVDLIIVSLHWGSEYVPYPSADQVRVARALVDAGADLILGGHPHVTQGYELYKERAIFYSLGNFVFDQTFIPATRESFVARIVLDDSGITKEIAIIPVRIHSTEYRPQLMSDPDKGQYLDTIEHVRTTIQGVPVQNYEKSLGDYSLHYTEFSGTAKNYMKKHFIKNIYRYPPGTLFSIVNTWRKKKVGVRRR